jgi:hypothetical protein
MDRLPNSSNEIQTAGSVYWTKVSAGRNRGRVATTDLASGPDHAAPTELDAYWDWVAINILLLRGTVLVMPKITKPDVKNSPIKLGIKVSRRRLVR